MPGFDYSKLSPAFAKLSKPAQRALIDAKIYTPRELARYRKREVAALHGIGPSAFPLLEGSLNEAGLSFKS